MKKVITLALLAVAVEPRYLPDILEGARDDGLRAGHGSPAILRSRTRTGFAREALT